MFLFLDNLAGWKIWSLLITKQLWKVPACLLPLLSLPSLQYVDRLLAVRSLTGGWKNSDNSEYQTKPKQLFTRVQVSWGENCPVEHWNFDSGKVKKKTHIWIAPWSTVSLKVPDFTISVCTAVHVIRSFSVSFTLLFFLHLFHGIPSSLEGANT